MDRPVGVLHLQGAGHARSLNQPEARLQERGADGGDGDLAVAPDDPHALRGAAHLDAAEGAAHVRRPRHVAQGHRPVRVGHRDVALHQRDLDRSKARPDLRGPPDLPPSDAPVVVDRDERVPDVLEGEGAEGGLEVGRTAHAADAHVPVPVQDREIAANEAGLHRSERVGDPARAARVREEDAPVAVDHDRSLAHAPRLHAREAVAHVERPLNLGDADGAVLVGDRDVSVDAGHLDRAERVLQALPAPGVGDGQPAVGVAHVALGLQPFHRDVTEAVPRLQGRRLGQRDLVVDRVRHVPSALVGIAGPYRERGGSLLHVDGHLLRRRRRFGRARSRDADVGHDPGLGERVRADDHVALLVLELEGLGRAHRHRARELARHFFAGRAGGGGRGHHEQEQADGHAGPAPPAVGRATGHPGPLS